MRHTCHTGEILSELETEQAPHGKFRNRWPIHIDPDNIAHVFIKHRFGGVAYLGVGTRARRCAFSEEACSTPAVLSYGAWVC